MPRIYVEFTKFRNLSDDCHVIQTKMQKIQSNFANTVNKLDWEIKYEADINKVATKVTQRLESHHYALKDYHVFLEDAYRMYLELDRFENNWKLDTGLGSGSGVIKDKVVTTYTLVRDLLLDSFKKAVKKTDVGKFIEYIKNFTNANSLAQLIYNGYNLGDFMKDAIDKFNRYQKIGRAIGTKQATVNWLKNITGLKKVGRTSTAKNVATRFKNNLTNKTSPFNIKKQFGDMADDYLGKNGAKAAGARWAGTAITLGVNYLDNKKEQQENGMSDARVVAETVSETVISTVASTAATAAVNAGVCAIATAAGVACPPVLVVSVATGFILGAVNTGIAKATGQTATEWVSDGILNAGGWVAGKAVQGVKGIGSKVIGLVGK